jgi:hypothetical protein
MAVMMVSVGCEEAKNAADATTDAVSDAAAATGDRLRRWPWI